VTNGLRGQPLADFDLIRITAIPSCAIAPSAVQQLILTRVDVPASPSFHRGSLKGTTVRKTQLPWGVIDLVHRVEVLRRQCVLLSAGKSATMVCKLARSIIDFCILDGSQ
jgi:hypothetical protein